MTRSNNIVSRASSPESAAQLADQVSWLMTRLAAAGDPDLRTIALARLNGNRPAEIAAWLGCSRRSVERKLSMIARLWSSGESTSSAASFDSLTLTLMHAINDRCNRFEGVWQAGGRPAIEDFLTGLDPNAREVVLVELRAIDAEYLDAVRISHRQGPVPQRRFDRLLQAHAELAEQVTPTPLLGATVTNALYVSSAAKANGLALIAEQIGNRVGPYRLLQKLGEGGMGAVWVAEQDQPMRRRVALKLIKPGMDSERVIARFDAERQALALMDHTNIAKILDAGTASSGRPYFVMELVKGVPITHYCDELHLGIHERLELFVQVCAAVQHAHLKGVIHRDLKPSNVLVAIQDGKPIPKVIDFGVAKAP